MILPANVTGITSYNADNEQSTFNGTSLTYDANGNLTGDGTNTYTWDARNHLTQITQRRTIVRSFIYDAFGRRMSKTISGTTTQFLYDGFNPIQELNSNNVATANLLTGLNIDEFFSRTDSSGARSFLTDIRGSTLALTDSSGTIQTQYTYEPFGNVTVSGAANSNSYQFTGRENDGTGLYFYRARYYSPTFQRFIAQDPIGLAGGDTNLYAYVGENPLVYNDPSGLGGIPGHTGCIPGRPCPPPSAPPPDLTPCDKAMVCDICSGLACVGMCAPEGSIPWCDVKCMAGLVPACHKAFGCGPKLPSGPPKLPPLE